MPAKNPRITLTVSPAQMALLQDLARLQGRPASACLSEMLSPAWPVLEKVRDALQRVSQVQQEQVAEIETAYADAEALAVPAMDALLGLLDSMATGKNPRLVIRGSDFDKTQQKQQLPLSGLGGQPSIQNEYLGGLYSPVPRAR